MRVIAGNFKGKKLNSPKTENVRPTGDKVKQAIFTKLQFFIRDAIVLDLFSGSGALGIEAISRDAKEVVFVDNNLSSIKLTKLNLKSLNVEAKVIHADYKTALNCLNKKFDLILIDPPYASGVYEDCLNIIHDNNLLSDNGIIVCERDKQKEIDCSCFELFDTKNYGTVSVDYYKKKSF